MSTMLCVLSIAGNLLCRTGDGVILTPWLERDAGQAHNPVAYAAMIKPIVSGSADRFAPWFLIGLPSFDRLAAKGAMYIDDCVKYVAVQAQDQRNQFIAVAAMYALDIDDKVNLIRRLLQYYELGLISESWIYRVVDLTHYPRVFVEHYLDARVQASLIDIRSQPGISDGMKESLARILRGQTLWALQWQRRMEFGHD